MRLHGDLGHQHPVQRRLQTVLRLAPPLHPRIRCPAAAGDAAADPPTTATPPPALTTPADAAAAVSDLLALIADTDRGSSAPPATSEAADALVDALAAYGAVQAPRPLEGNPLLWGGWDVAYVGTRNTRQSGQPAGGRFRSRLGRALFATAAVRQGVYEGEGGAAPLVTNCVSFRAFGGLLPGHIGLRGVVSVVGDPATAARSAHPASQGGDTVRVAFGPPELLLGAADHPAAAALRIGPPSAVQLSTTFLDRRVRLGRGSFGSRFVFTRLEGGEGSPDGEALRGVGTHVTRPAGWAALAAVLGACGLAAAAAAGRSAWPLAGRLAAASVPALVATLLVAAVAKDRLIALRGPGRERGNEGTGDRVAAPPAAAGGAAAAES